MAEAGASARLREIVAAEGLVINRLADAIGISPPHVRQFMCDQMPFGPSRMGLVMQWLAKWDAADVDIDPLKQDNRINQGVNRE